MIQSDQAKLQSQMADFDSWNSLTVEQRARYLQVGLWDAFNYFSGQLTKEEAKTLKEHPDFRDLRLIYTECRTKGDPEDLVLRLTDAMERAFRKLRS